MYTIDVASEVPVADMAFASRFVEVSQQPVVVERNGTPCDEADDASSPAQIGHDQRRIAQNKRRVQRCHDEEPHDVPLICHRHHSIA